MKTADLVATAGEHLSCAIDAVEARLGKGAATKCPELVSAFMRSMALGELAHDVRELNFAVNCVEHAVSDAAETIASAVLDQ